MKDHKPIPVTVRGALVCQKCGRAVRTAFGGQYAIHASVR